MCWLFRWNSKKLTPEENYSLTLDERILLQWIAKTLSIPMKNLEKDPNFLQHGRRSAFHMLVAHPTLHVNHDKNKDRETTHEAMNLLVRLGADVNARDALGETPLQLLVYSMYRNDGEYQTMTLYVISILLEYGVEAGVKDRVGMDTLHSLVNLRLGEDNPVFTQKLARIVIWLFDHGVHPAAKDDSGWTALHRLVNTITADNKEGKLTIARLILNHGVDLGAQDRFGKTALHRVLCEHLTSRNKESKLAMVKLLFEYGANLSAQDDRGLSVLHYLVMLQDGEGWRANIDIIKWLLENGANPKVQDHNGWTPLHRLIIWLNKNNHRDRNNGDRNNEERTLEVMDWLLKYGANLSAKDNNGWSALHHLVDVPERGMEKDHPKGKLTVIRWLLEHGANPKVQDDTGWSVFYRLVDGVTLDNLETSMAVASMLLEHGAGINEQNSRTGKTILHFLVGRIGILNEEASLQFLTMLLAQPGVDPNIQDESGETVLNCFANRAMAWRQFQDANTTTWKGIDILLQHGADPTIANKIGTLPLDYFNGRDSFIATAVFLLARSTMVPGVL